MHKVSERPLLFANRDQTTSEISLPAEYASKTVIWKDFLEPNLQQFNDYCQGTAQTLTSMFIILKLVGGSATVYRTYTTTNAFSFSTTSSVTSTSPPEQTLPAVESSQAAEPDSPPSESKAWIAGPVIGALVVVALLVGGFWFLRRRGKRKGASRTAEDSDGKKGRHEKAELHADGVPNAPPMELEGSYPRPVPEMSANEVTAHEMLAPDKHVRPAMEMP